MHLQRSALLATYSINPPGRQLAVKQQGTSRRFGDWSYVPAQIELGKL